MSAILSVFNIADLKPIDRLVLVYLRSLAEELGAAFPSYETIAAKCGISRRTAINAVKRLVEGKLIKKDHRYKDDVAAEAPKAIRQTSNSYRVSIADESSSAPLADEVMPPSAPERSSSFNPVIKTEEENIKTHAHAETPYLPFESEIENHAIPSEIRSAILAYIVNVRQYSAEAIRNAFGKAAARIKAGVKFDNFPKWVAVAIRNEDFALSQRPKSSWSDVLQRAKMATAHLT